MLKHLLVLLAVTSERTFLISGNLKSATDDELKTCRAEFSRIIVAHQQNATASFETFNKVNAELERLNAKLLQETRKQVKFLEEKHEENRKLQREISAKEDTLSRTFECRACPFRIGSCKAFCYFPNFYDSCKHNYEKKRFIEDLARSVVKYNRKSYVVNHNSYIGSNGHVRKFMSTLINLQEEIYNKTYANFID